MKTKRILLIFTVSLFVVSIILSSFRPPSGDEPWRPDQLMDPAELARVINDPQAYQPVLLSIGPAAVIKNSIDIGNANRAVPISGLNSKGLKGPSSYVASGQTIGKVIINI